MPLIRKLTDLPKNFAPAVVSIGNFDGVHLGHQSVIKQLKVQSERLGLPMVVVTFDPLAKEYFSAKFSPNDVSKLPARICGIERRAQWLESYGVDCVICLDFNESLETQSANDFIQSLIVETLQAKFLVVGDDFHFGYQRKGDFNLLTEAGKKFGFSVQAMDTYRVDDERVSSGRVRDALQQHDFTLVKRLLGRDFSIWDVARKGQRLGSSIGFPTANLDMSGFRNSSLPLRGVFAVKAAVEGFDHLIEGVANIGVRPTVDGEKKSLEVHLLDFHTNEIKDRLNNARQSVDTEASYDLYGLELEVFFMHAIRDEIKFSNVEELQTQIARDVEVARAYFANV
jgi:riboflavin kinase/FMN adenylyltransferase